MSTEPFEQLPLWPESAWEAMYDLDEDEEEEDEVVEDEPDGFVYRALTDCE